MDEATRRLVRTRAGHRCEYCRLSQESIQFISLHIEHIIPKKHGGGDDASNLALACHHCNLHKGPNLAGIDPETSTIAHLFDPRRQDWHEHFTVRGPLIAGRTPTGRATVVVLNMNAADRIKLRLEFPNS